MKRKRGQHGARAIREFKRGENLAALKKRAARPRRVHSATYTTKGVKTIGEAAELAARLKARRDDEVKMLELAAREGFTPLGSREGLPKAYGKPEPASGWIDEKGAVHPFAKPDETATVKVEVDTGNAEQRLADLGKNLDRVKAKAEEVGERLGIVTISSMLNDLDLALDALEGRLQRVLRPEPAEGLPSRGYSDVSRDIAYAIERVKEITSRVDL